MQVPPDLQEQAAPTLAHLQLSPHPQLPPALHPHPPEAAVDPISAHLQLSPQVQVPPDLHLQHLQSSPQLHAPPEAHLQGLTHLQLSPHPQLPPVLHPQLVEDILIMISVDLMPFYLKSSEVIEMEEER